MYQLRKRTLLKAVTWEASGLVVLMAISWIISGNFAMSSTLSLIYIPLRIFMYYAHERLWKRIGWGKYKGDGNENRSCSDD